MSTPTLNLPLTPEQLITVIRAGLPHADLGTNISKAAASAASVTINGDGSASIGIPAAGLSLGAKGGGGRKKKSDGE